MYQTSSELALFGKTFLCVFSVHSSDYCSLAKRECRVSQGRVDTIQFRQKTFTFLYDKFTWDNRSQILSQSVRFCRLYIKEHFGVFFSVHSVDGTWWASVDSSASACHEFDILTWCVCPRPSYTSTLMKLAQIFTKILHSPCFQVSACCDPKKLVSTTDPNTSVTKTGCNSLHWYVICGVHMVFGSLPAVTVTSKILTPKSNQHIYKRGLNRSTTCQKWYFQEYTTLTQKWCKIGH